MTGPHFSMDINLGQVLVIGVVSALGYGLRTIFKAAKGAVEGVRLFVGRAHANDDLLGLMAPLVDNHTRALVLAELMKLPVVQLTKAGRRHGDPHMFLTKEDLLTKDDL